MYSYDFLGKEENCEIFFKSNYFYSHYHRILIICLLMVSVAAKTKMTVQEAPSIVSNLKILSDNLQNIMERFTLNDNHMDKNS